LESGKGAFLGAPADSNKEGKGRVGGPWHERKLPNQCEINRHATQDRQYHENERPKDHPILEAINLPAPVASHGLTSIKAE
jgi:hypothetical protein